MGGAGRTPISRGNVPFWIFQSGTPNFIRSATPCWREGVRRIRNASRVPPHTIMVLVLVLVLVLGLVLVLVPILFYCYYYYYYYEYFLKV